MFKFSKINLLLSLSFAGLTTFSIAAYAQERVQVILPQCLLKTLNSPYKLLSSSASLSLIDIDANTMKKLINVKHEQQASHCGGFRNVSKHWEEFKRRYPEASTKADVFLAYHSVPKPTSFNQGHYAIHFENKVNTLLDQLNPQEMVTNLTTLTAFHDRDAASNNGLKAAEWVKQQVDKMAKQYHRKDVTISVITTDGPYVQPSVVVKLGNSTNPGIVLGAHLDTVSGEQENKPGADDDGTGVVTVLEVARTLLASGAQFKKPIYFIWYAAEEPGLCGSESVVTSFINQGIRPEAVLQLDMTGFHEPGDESIWLVDDYVDTKLTAYLAELTKTYVKKSVNHTSCGYGCSDHASWFLQGIPAAHPFEAPVGKDNPYVHTANDTMALLSWDHITDFAKLSLSFAVELAIPVG
jgi:leucyl aminopeptidase